MAKEAFDKNWERPAFKGVLLKRTSTQSVASGSSNTIVWQAAVYDTNGFWSSTTNPGRITVRPGIKFVRTYGSIEISSTDTNRTRLAVLKNGASVFGEAVQTTTVESGSTIISAVSAPIEVSENDYFELNFVQNSGSARTIQKDETTWFGMEVLG